MIELLDEFVMKVEDLALNGYGVSWHSVHQMYWPFQIDGDSIDWWHDSEGCADKSFVKAILRTHAKMLGVSEDGKYSAVFESAKRFSASCLTYLCEWQRSKRE